MISIFHCPGLFGKLKRSLSGNRTKSSGKNEKEGEVEVRPTDKAGKGNRLTALYLGAVDRSRSVLRSSEASVKPRRSFNRSNFKVDKDEIKKAYHDVRSDKTGISIIDVNIDCNLD